MVDVISRACALYVRHMSVNLRRVGFVLLATLLSTSAFADQVKFSPSSHFLEVKDFKFNDGKSVPNLKLHYQTLGKPRLNAKGEIENAVLLLHGTGGQGSDFLLPSFADPLFAPGKPLDITKYFIILPDSVGHGKSSKPSDGMKASFPKYNYADMVALQHRIVVDTLKIKKLRLILGTSMGCMHTYVWGVTYPDAMRALMNMSCSPFPVAGLNWTWRKGMIDAITSDPEWQGGNYQSQPAAGMRSVALLSEIAVNGAPNLATKYPTQAAVESMLKERIAATMKFVDANDTIYQFSASTGYDAWSVIDRIKVPVLWWDSADDFINPPTLPYPKMVLKKMKNFRYKLLPASADTTGHMTFLQAKYFASDVANILKRSEK